MKHAPALITASTLLALTGCVSSGPKTGDPAESAEGTEPGPAPEQDRGLEGEGVGSASSAPDTNPDGIPYPTEGIGTLPRKRDRPGNRIANFKFLGYPNGDVSAGLQPVSLAEYYDPSGTKYRILHIEAAGVWCTACQLQAEAVTPMKAALEAKKAVWFVSLAEGAKPGVPSTDKDLIGWIDEFKSPYTHVLDPGNHNLGPFYNAAALPWNANIDARTMEILSATTGGAVEEEAILEEIDRALAAADRSQLL